MEKEPLKTITETDLTSPIEAKKPKTQVGFLDLFRFATRFDKMMMFVGAVAAIFSGLALPLMVIQYNNS